MRKAPLLGYIRDQIRIKRQYGKIGWIVIPILGLKNLESREQVTWGYLDPRRPRCSSNRNLCDLGKKALCKGKIAPFWGFVLSSENALPVKVSSLGICTQFQCPHVPWPRSWHPCTGHWCLLLSRGFPSGPGGTVVRNPPANAGEAVSIPGLGRFPGGGHGNPLQYSCLENPVDRGAWWATDHGVAVRHSWACTAAVACCSDSWGIWNIQHPTLTEPHCMQALY